MRGLDNKILIAWIIGMVLCNFHHVGAEWYTHSWSKGFGDYQDQLESIVSVDHANNALITGSFRGSIDFGGSVITSAGNYDVFLAKFDSSGNHLWSKAFGDSSSQYGNCVTTDNQNNVIIIGAFASSIDFGGGQLTADSSDIFLAKFSSDGNHLWSKRFGGPDAQFGYWVTVDSSDNILITGHFWSGVDFGGVPLPSSGDEDIYIAKFDGAGNHIWSKSFGDSSPQEGACVVTDTFNRVIMTGGFLGSVDFGGGVLTSAGEMDIFLAKFDANGNHMWSKRFGGLNRQQCRVLAIDSLDNLIITSGFKGTIDFGGGPLSSTADSYDVYLAKLDSDGNHVWSSIFGYGSDELAYGINTDSEGSIMITGGFYGSLNFGENLLMSAGGSDVFLVKLSRAGEHLWSAQYGGSGFESGTSLVCDDFNNMMLLGHFSDSVDFGNGPLVSAGGVDVFLAQFSQYNETPSLGYTAILVLLAALSFLLMKRCS